MGKPFHKRKRGKGPKEKTFAVEFPDAGNSFGWVLLGKQQKKRGSGPDEKGEKRVGSSIAKVAYCEGRSSRRGERRVRGG